MEVLFSVPPLSEYGAEEEIIMLRVKGRSSLKVTWIVFLIIILGATAIIMQFETKSAVVASAYQENNDPRAVDTVSIVHACPTDIEPSLGSSWRDITIGVSNHGAIQDLYGVTVVFHNLILAEEGFAYANGIFLTPSNAEELGVPDKIEYCQVNNTLLAINMGLPTDGTYPAREVGQIGDIHEWLLEYGQPEFVAWREGTSDWCSRILVWPELGMAVNFDVSVVDSDPTLAWATEISLFPFATDDDYLDHWPYNDYLDNTEPTGNNLDGCPINQNPFDFEIMLRNSISNGG